VILIPARLSSVDEALRVTVYSQQPFNVIAVKVCSDANRPGSIGLWAVLIKAAVKTKWISCRIFTPEGYSIANHHITKVCRPMFFGHYVIIIMQLFWSCASVSSSLRRRLIYHLTQLQLYYNPRAK
jgi:hypothetical protein